MYKKQLYEAPDAELLVIRYEEAFLTGTTVLGDTSRDDYDYDDLDDDE